MQDADAFDGVVFLGTARTAKRDPYRLSLFGAHLESDERPLVILPVQGGTLLVTDRRLLELRAHLEVHGAWNVKEFQGYMIQRSIDRGIVRDIEHAVRPTVDGVGSRRVRRWPARARGSRRPGGPARSGTRRCRCTDFRTTGRPRSLACTPRSRRRTGP